MNAEQIIKTICDNFRYDLSVNENSVKVYQRALQKGLDKRYNPIAVAVGAVYFYCKSTGKPIILKKIVDMFPVETEEITAIYNELKTSALR